VSQIDPVFFLSVGIKLNCNTAKMYITYENNNLFLLTKIEILTIDARI